MARPANGQSALSAEERALASYVDQHNDAGLDLLKRAVNVNSGTENLAGVRQVGAIFRAEFDALGFQTQWVDGHEWNRAGHLIAEHRGVGPRLLLIGHLDTVFAPDSPFQQYESIDAKTARGPGIIDMKGGDVIIVQALKALEAAGLLKTMNVCVVMTGDEEAPGSPLTLARAALMEAAKGATAAIGFEDGDGDPAHGIIARRGFASWTLNVTAKSGHSGQIFSDGLGHGAIFETARILDAFHDKLREPYLTFSPGAMVGGTEAHFDAASAKGSAFGKDNVIAAQAIVTGDLRALQKEQFERAMKAMKAIVAQSLPQTSGSITFEEGYPPLPPSEGNSKLLGLYDRASRDLGLGAVGTVSADRFGAADVSFVAGLVPMIMDGVGMKGHDDHSVQETADLTTLAVQIKRAAVLLARLARSGNPEKPYR
jgi:glutamate carboxypeptidase